MIKSIVFVPEDIYKSVMGVMDVFPEAMTAQMLRRMLSRYDYQRCEREGREIYENLFLGLLYPDINIKSRNFTEVIGYCPDPEMLILIETDAEAQKHYNMSEWIKLFIRHLTKFYSVIELNALYKRYINSTKKQKV